MGSDVATRPVTEAARHDWDGKQVEAIRRTVAKDCSNEELAMFLEIASRYQLDPFRGEIWAAKMPGRNAGAGRVAIIVGRDGLLKVANRHADFMGITHDAVYENDEFVKRETSEGPIVEHTVGKPSERGKLLGAWALVHRTPGKLRTYFYAPIEQYRPTSERKLEFSPWGQQEDAMIIKCAMSNALRLAFNLTGIYDESEMARVVRVSDEEVGEIDWGEDDLLAHHLGALFATANALVPDSYKPAKIRLLLEGKTDGERQDVAAEVETFIRDHGGEVPEFPDALVGEVVDEAEVDQDVRSTA